MKSRLLVAAVGIPLLVVILLLCPPVVTAVALAALCAIGASELLKTTGILTHKRMVVYSMIASVLVVLWSYVGCPVRLFVLGTVIFALLLFCEALAAYPEVKFYGVLASLFAGIAIPLCLSSVLRILMGDYGRHLVLVPILIPFIADAGAYFAGMLFGKHKMAPVLSPKKTIEGAIGGFVVGILSMVVYGVIMQFGFGMQYNYLFGAVYGLLGSAVSIVGDLSFSMIKREHGIKDYGTLFRAHGGVLDRFDSVIFAAPIVELLLMLIPVLS